MTTETTILPTLTGSDKQIAWASQIRDAALASLDAHEASERRDCAAFAAKGKLDIVASYDDVFARIAEARARISAATSAAAIIDQRVFLDSIRRNVARGGFPKSFCAALPLPV